MSAPWQPACIRAAADFGYCPMLIEDTTATASDDAIQQDCVNRIDGRFCEVVKTPDFLEDLEQHIRSVRKETGYW